MAISAVVVGGAATLGSAYLSSQASKNAANTQANAANQAAGVQQQANDRAWAQYQQTRSDLNPYMATGQDANGAFYNMLGLGIGGNPLTSYLGSPSPGYRDFNPTMEELQRTPGYQFTLQQGLQGVGNQMSAMGLAGSGNHMRGVADYATGLASTTYQNQLQNYMNQYQTGFNADTTNKTNIFNRYLQATQLGENAAAQSGNMGTTTAANTLQGAGNVGNALIGMGNASAAGTMGSAQAWSQGIQGLGGLATMYAMKQG